MIETDCPYLIPRNLNDKPKNNRNEPSYLPHIAEEIAGLVKIDVNKFAQVTYANSINFFK
jgi:TatD DNase family protein